MKNNHFIIVAVLFFSNLSSQVAIGKSSLTANSAVSLEFYDGVSPANTRGLILPWASTVSGTPNSSYLGFTSVVDGTLIFDIFDEKIKYRKDGAWYDLTIKNKTDAIPGITNVTLDFTHQNSLEEKQEARVIIGSNAETDSTPGILVLSDSNKAMILPKVIDPNISIINPSAGMIVYDPAKRLLAVFNGTVWSYWKP